MVHSFHILSCINYTLHFGEEQGFLMLVILDGYNLLKQVFHTSSLNESERNSALTRIAARARVKKYHVLVVFDGYHAEYAPRTVYGTTTVVYSGARRSADEYIIEYVRAIREHCIVVTGDRALAQAIRSHRCEIMSPHLYWETICASDKAVSKPPEQKTHGIRKLSDSSSRGLDALMEQAARGVRHAKDEGSDDEPMRPRSQKSTSRI